MLRLICLTAIIFTAIYTHQVRTPSEEEHHIPTTTTTTTATSPELVSLGEFKITHYCSCEICCGKWAYNRPKDENGNDVVYGNSGNVLIPGYSVGADLNVYPHGTKFYNSDGELMFEVMDTGGALNGNHLDLFMSSHEEACNAGVARLELFAKGE